MVWVAWLIVVFFVWFVLWYLIYYFRYENRHIVDQLRNELKDANKQKLQYQQDLEEYKAQNEILKQKLEEVLKKNDDLTKVVSELSRYYYKIKVGSEKIKDLSKEFEILDDDIINKIQQYWQTNQNNKDCNLKDNNLLEEQKQFF